MIEHVVPARLASPAMRIGDVMHVARVTMTTFLYLNGWHVQAPDDAKIALMLDVATDVRPESDIASWLQRHATHLP